MKIIKIEPGKQAYIANIESDLKTLQSVVDGYIEVIYPFEDNIAIVCNEEGKIRSLPINRVLCDNEGNATDVICGTFFICGIAGEGFCDIPTELIQKYLDMFKFPEEVSVKTTATEKILIVKKIGNGEMSYNF